MKKQIYINGRFLTQATTGVQRYGQEIVTGLDRMIHEGEIDRDRYNLTVLTPPNCAQLLSLKEIKIKPVGHFNGHLWEQVDLPNHTRDGLLFCAGNLAPSRSLRANRPTVVTLHDLSFIYFAQAYSRRFTLLYEFVVDLVLRLATNVITVSEYEKERILNFYPQATNRLHTIHSGVRWPSEQLYSVSGTDSKKYILFVGSLNRIKNLEKFLEALYLAQAAFPIPLKVVGSNAGKVFKPVDYAKVLRNLTGVEFLGQVNDPDRLHQLYHQAAFLAMPSFSESFGFPCLEAMTRGCPVLASNIGALREICGEAALYCNPADPIDMAEKILQLWSHPHKRETLAARGYEQARRFSWDRTARETWRVLEETAA